MAQRTLGHREARQNAKYGRALLPDLTTQTIRRDVFRSVAELTVAIVEHLAVHNAPKRFVWTATANDILANVMRARIALDIKQSD